MIGHIPVMRRPGAEIAACACLGAVIAWLGLSAALVDIEYYDGISAICNARYFLGHSPFYFFDRGPLMAVLQMAPEAVKEWLGLGALEFRPHHAVMVSLHAAYLIVVYRLLARHFGHRWFTLVAFVTAITNYVFFSYAPFLSHDIAPGVLLLSMLLWSDEFARAPRVRTWLLLVTAGAAAPLVKQTFGVFWLAVLAAHAVPGVLHLEQRSRTSWRSLQWLAAGAAASAVIAWVVYGLVLAGWAPTMSPWLRPWRNLEYLRHEYDGTGATFPLWIYVRNFWAYGRLTTLLLVPGLVLSLRGTPLQRRMAIAWITAAAAIQAMPLREVRYLAFLAPLSAFVIVPAVRLIGESRPGVAVMAVLLALDAGGATIEASRIATPFYRHSELRALLQPLAEHGRVPRPFYANVSMFSFVSPDPSPLAADRYHHIFHVGIIHIALLHGYSPDDIRVLPPRAAAVTARATAGSLLLFSNGILAHGPTWTPAPPVGTDTFVQGIATLQTIALERRPDGRYRTASGEPVDLASRHEGSQAVLAIEGAAPPGGQQGYLLPVTILENGDVYPLQARPDGSFVLAGGEAAAAFARAAAPRIRLFVIQRLSRPATPR